MDYTSPLELGTFIVNKFNDRYLYPVNRDTFRQVDAHTHLKKMFGDNFAKENTLHIVVGTDSGLLLRYLHQVGIPETSRYIFIELPEVLLKLQEEGLLDKNHERMSCIAFEDLSETTQKFEFANYLYTETINLWQSFAAIDAFLPEYAELYLATRDFVETLAWQIKVQLGSQLFIARQLENLPENRHPANGLTNLFPGKTAVLLAAGPSLDDILPWVREHREHLVVLAVSRIARRLREVGLTPDIFFSVDPQDVSFDVSKEMLYFGERTLFVNSYHVLPKLLSQWQGPAVFVGPRWPWTEATEENHLDAPGPTVTNTAFHIATEMGFAQIVLGGVDLCFSQNGASHALGNHERAAGPQFAGFATQVSVNRGGEAFTTRAMAEAISVFGEMSARAQQKGCRTINPSPTAAVIPHVEHLALEDLVLAPLAEPAWAHIVRALPAENGQTRVSYYKKALEKLETAEKNIRAIQKLARKGLHCNDGLFGRNGMRRDFKYKIRMDKIEKSLHASHLAPFVALVKSAGLSHFVRIARPNTAQEWSDDQVEETGRLYYQAFIDSADYLLDILTVAGRRLQLRLQEENPDTDPNLLFDAWQNDAEPGRALLWGRRQGEAANNRPTPIQQRFEAVTALFAETLLQTPENFVKAARASADPKLARLRLRSLFKNRDAAMLSGLLQGMLAHQDGDVQAGGMEPIMHLAGGYLAELEEDFSLALNEYQQVLELDSSLVQEDALQRIASLSLQLQDHPNAFLALECLTAFSPMYLPQYAHLAGLMGQTRTALDAYASYLELFPDDPVALARVGKLYHQAGENAFAATIFRHLLQIDPDNKVACSFLKELGLPTESISA